MHGHPLDADPTRAYRDAIALGSGLGRWGLWLGMSIWTCIRETVATGGWWPFFGAATPRKHDPSIGHSASRSVNFTIAVIALSAKMAKADGVVTDDEIARFHQLFKVAETERANVAAFFNLARRSVHGAESYARQAAKILNHDADLLADLLGALFQIATADRHFAAEEDAFLARIAHCFGFDAATYRRIRARHLGTTEGRDAENRRIDDDPYVILGADPSMSLDEIAALWRTHVRDNHPDLAIARGLPAEFIALATEKLARINDAYDRIRAKPTLGTS